MKTSLVGCEYFLDFGEAGLYHVISADHLNDAVLDTLGQAAWILCHQYNADVLKCIEYVIDISFLDEHDIASAETYADLYLVNVNDYVGYCERQPIVGQQVYLMSHQLCVRFRNESEVDAQPFGEMIKDVRDQDGLLYAMVVGKDIIL